MSPGMIIMLIFFAGAALVAAIVIPVFRFVTNSLGIKQVLEEGAVLTENGLEFLDFLWYFRVTKVKVSYADIESVKLMPYYKGLLTIVLPRFDTSSRWIRRRPFHQIVVIEFMGSQVYKRLFFTPKDAPAFVEKLKYRMKEQGKTNYGQRSERMHDH
jgi:hypothetical protein